MATKQFRSASRIRSTAAVRWGRMSVVALALVTTSFAWLGLLLSDRNGAARARSVESTGPIDAVHRAPLSEIKQPASTAVAPVEAATTRAAGANDSAVSSAPASDSAALVSASDASNIAHVSDAESRHAAAPSTGQASDSPGAGVQPAPTREGDTLGSSPPLTRIESAPALEAARAASPSSTRRSSSTREPHRSAQPEGKPGVMQQQWALLRPSTQPSRAGAVQTESTSRGSAASRRAQPVPAAAAVTGDASGSPEPSNQPDVGATPDQRVGAGAAESPNGQPNARSVTHDNDPGRREQWLRDQLQIR
jgi:hypothetical protein